MPSNARGSVSARLSVWVSRVSAARNCSSVPVRTSSPPGSCAVSASAPCTRYNEARCFVPASVKVSDPGAKSKAARPARRGNGAPGAFQWSRPAIIRCSTAKYSSSNARTMRFPRRRTSVTPRPARAAGGGSAERSRNGLAMRRRSSRSPTMRGRRARRYRAMSGSSGKPPQLKNRSASCASRSSPSARARSRMRWTWAHSFGSPQ